jgi:hypothetical protein
MKRFSKYDITRAIIGLNLEEAKNISLFNGYNFGGDIKFWSINYEVEGDKIKKAWINI